MSGSPISRQKFAWLFAGCWLLWFGVHAWVWTQMGLSGARALADSAVSNGLLCLAGLLIYTSLRFYLPGRDRFWYILVLSVLASLLIGFLQRFLLEWGFADDQTYLRLLRLSQPPRLMLNFLIIAFIAVIQVLSQSFEEQQKASDRQQETARLAREAELMNLRQQLQPHFLFNSLNSINALIGFRPEEARQMVERLSRFLRSTLRQDHRQWVPLQEELDQLDLYLSIEQVRFGNRLQTLVHAGEEAARCRLPALLLQPLVENAIKFGIYGTTGETRIEVHAHVISGELVLAVINPYDPEATTGDTGTGFGLRSVRRRLYLLFGRSDLLETETEGHTFIVSVTIPQPDTESPDITPSTSQPL